MAATRAGVILGTAAYMSPEQARGKTVDKRTDIWAFGCVLYEMLTGKQAFHGEDVTIILAAVVMKEPAFEALPANTLPTIQTLVRRCLRKDRRERLPDAGSARIEIQEALSGTAAAASAPAVVAPVKTRDRLAWSLVAALGVVLVAVVGLGAFAYFGRAPEEMEAIRFFVSPPETWNLRRVAGGTSPAPLAVSPDGRRMAFVATGMDGISLLWVRPLDTLEAQSLTGTEGASSPFWSPDSRFVGFFAGGKLKKIEVSGGPPVTLCDTPAGGGGTWSRDGVIVFGMPGNSLRKVSATGGVPTAATTLAQGEVRHQRPFFLPDGRHFLYEMEGGVLGLAANAGLAHPIYVTSLDSTEPKMLLNADASNVVYSRGHLLFVRETTLMAQPFDAQRLELTGEAFPIAEQIQMHRGELHANFSASESGVLVYQTGTGVGGSQLTWFDRGGKQVGVLGDRAAYGDVWLSPDEKRVSVTISSGSTRDIWMYDVARGLKTRFTFDATDERAPIWSPDGSRIVVNSNRKGHYDLYQKASSGAGTEEVLLEDNVDKYAANWSPDGRFLLYRAGAAPYDIFILPLSGDRKPVPFLQTKFSEQHGQFSPDGRWVAYVSNESGTGEVYVVPFPGPGGKWQISAGGGAYPKWSRDGTELFYLAPDNKLMTAAVNGKGASFEIGAVKTLFETRAVTGLGHPFNVSADGQRFLINTLPEQSGSAPITVVVNWTAGVKK
jgi:Tol biopolymer transport system component